MLLFWLMWIYSYIVNTNYYFLSSNFPKIVFIILWNLFRALNIPKDITKYLNYSYFVWKIAFYLSLYVILTTVNLYLISSLIRKVASNIASSSLSMIQIDVYFLFRILFKCYNQTLIVGLYYYFLKHIEPVILLLSMMVKFYILIVF